MRITVALVALGLSGCPRSAPPAAAPSDRGAQADLEHLYATLQAAHFDLYAHRSQAAYEAEYARTHAALEGAADERTVARELMRFTAFGRVGHARIEFPVEDYISYVTSGGTLLPLDIRVSDGRTWVAHSYTEAVPVGTELLALDDRPIGDWLDRLGGYVSGERPYMVHAQLETLFPRLLWLDQGRVDRFTVVLGDGDGEREIELAAGDALAIEQQKAGWEAPSEDRVAKLLPEEVAYLRPGAFHPVGEEQGVEPFLAFIDDAFGRFIEAGARDLIVDLRDNPGGDSAFSDPLIAWFADEPFRFASRYELKASAVTRGVLEGLSAKEPDGVSAAMLAAMGEHDDGDRFAFPIPEAAPRADGFDGRVWVLVHRRSWSNATVTAAIIQDHGFGTILGEETADLPTSYASSAQFTLPDSGLTVTYPKACFVRPSGEEAVRGVVPDHVLVDPLLSGEEDAMLQAAIAHVLSQRTASAER